MAKYIVSQNIHRRHLKTHERAEIAAKMANMPCHRPNKEISASNEAVISQSEAAKLMGVSRSSVQRASQELKPNPKVKAILKDPEAKRSLDSDGCVSKAYQIARENAKAKESEEVEEVEVTEDVEDNGIVEDNEEAPKRIVRYWLPCYVDIEADYNMEKAKAFFERLLRTGGIRVSESNNDELQRFLNVKP